MRLAMRSWGWSQSQLSPAPVRSRLRPVSSVSDVVDIGAWIEVGMASTKTFLAKLLAFYSLLMTFDGMRMGQQAVGAPLPR